MQSGELIVVRLNSGPGIGRFVEADSTRVKIAIGRNKEARLPLARVMLTTGMKAAGHEAVENLTREAETVASELDLTDLWDIVCDDRDALSLEDMAELYWSDEPTSAQRVGLLFHLDRNDLRFTTKGSEYTPRTREEVAELEARRERTARHAEEAVALAECLSSGKLPEEITSHQAHLLDQIRGLAVFGDDYTRAASAKKYLESITDVSRDPQRTAFLTLANAGHISRDEFLALEQAAIPIEFSDDVLAEASSLDVSSQFDDSHRRDLTSLDVITVDDEDTTDRDDGLSIEYVEADIDGVMTDAYRVGIHIADASSIVQPESALDKDADRRMATMYLPERKIWMLPPQVAADLGSLSPGERRLAVSLLATISKDAEVVSWEVTPSIIQSRAALSYDTVDARIADQNAPMHRELSSLRVLAKKIKAKRESTGTPNLDRDELSVKVSESGEITVNVLQRSNPARTMIAEFMIFYNAMLAEFCKKNELPAPYRSQKAPDLSDIVAQTPEGLLRWYLTVRKMGPATISTEPGAHAGLGVPAYIQASSPLRRYPDLVIQRQVSHFLKTGEKFYSDEEISSVAQRADMQIREISRMEFDREKYWFLKHLDTERRELERAGEESIHEAYVLDNQPNRAGVMDLVQYPFRVRAALGSEVKPGEVVKLRLHSVDLWRRVGQFVVAAPVSS
ncbi:MAG TPA: RNB domain-containing ribonuclease [Dehalococcoidia bacterium]|nr:RNB domain-containing ribonuclease [Dehalococcoidia bacterium]|tara:strand:+ start:5056 stop:7098 length:2043 start_codon:yes stop_codon:yes gene_type:complete